MSHSFDILLVARRREVLQRLEQALRPADFTARLQLNTNGHVDPLYGTDKLPDVLILHLSHLWSEELEALAARRADRRPALIVVAPAIDMNVMRLAMQAGARDVLPDTCAHAEVIEAVRRAREERQASAARARGTLTAFMNAKGGCGATLLACNVAHVHSVVSNKRTALIDLDLEFGAAPLYLDLYPKRGIAQALDNLSGLDEVALEGYFARHASGLSVLSHGADEPLTSRQVTAAAVSQLIDVTQAGFEQVVLDLPRSTGVAAATVVGRADRVVLVLQQSVAALRDAARLVQWLRTEAGVDRERLCVVVNRYDKSAGVSVDDIEKALACDEPSLVPNDFKAVSECINSGIPLLEHSRGSAIARAVMALETRLGGTSAQARAGLIARTFANLMNGRSS